MLDPDSPEAHLEAGWQQRLDALETEVHRTRRERRTAAGHSTSLEETA